MNLIEGQALPMSFYLRKSQGSYKLRGSVHTQRGWLGIDSDQTITLGRWHSVGVMFTGSVVAVLLNNRVIARRVLQPSDILKPVGDVGFLVGTWVDGRRHQFHGLIGGLRIWADPPQSVSRPLEIAERVGMGAIESKYLDLGGARSFLRGPESRTRHSGRTHAALSGRCHLLVARRAEPTKFTAQSCWSTGAAAAASPCSAFRVPTRSKASAA
ncbi:MAG: hypothetical protein U5L06_03780 [Rhodovibrio sp.]|nr:hypothetical protein [Rhodovibrio sp.]